MLAQSEKPAQNRKTGEQEEPWPMGEEVEEPMGTKQTRLWIRLGLFRQYQHLPVRAGQEGRGQCIALLITFKHLFIDCRCCVWVLLVIHLFIYCFIRTYCSSESLPTNAEASKTLGGLSGQDRTDRKENKWYCKKSMPSSCGWNRVALNMSRAGSTGLGVMSISLN